MNDTLQPGASTPIDERLSDPQIMAVIGARLRRQRLSRNITIDALATRAGLAEKTIRNLEDGRPATTATVIAVLRALGSVGLLEAVFPDAGPSPIELADRHGQARQRATGISAVEPEPWEW